MKDIEAADATSRTQSIGGVRGGLQGKRASLTSANKLSLTNKDIPQPSSKGTTVPFSGLNLNNSKVPQPKMAKGGGSLHAQSIQVDQVGKSKPHSL